MSILSFRHCLSEAFRSRVFLAGSLFERGRSVQGVGCEGAFSNPVNIDKNRLMFSRICTWKVIIQTSGTNGGFVCELF